MDEKQFSSEVAEEFSPRWMDARGMDRDRDIGVDGNEKKILICKKQDVILQSNVKRMKKY